LNIIANIKTNQILFQLRKTNSYKKQSGFDFFEIAKNTHRTIY